ncbi:hypothetical protein [Acidiferrobacter sp.]|jgi:hypothetical protein|uniref:hypothetical protein n=1 Tax=Acidiferrobacter sp. TaxID=1872107 RepID=UPI002616E0AB|nr:hypothetical protein [Acidiferrobacter sp.]
MAGDVLSVFKEAVQSRCCCALRYRDQIQVRVVEPHAVYEDASGEIIVDCYQISGYSESGRTPPFWRPFRMRKVSAAALLKQTFAPRHSEGFSATRSRYRNGLICAVSDAGAPAMRAPAAPTAPVGPFRPAKTLRR